MSTFLAEMARTSRERMTAARAREPLTALEARARSIAPLRPLTLSAFDLIAEVKPASPSRGPLLRAGEDATGGCVARAQAYAAGGAAAISVLTEPSRFGGSVEVLRAVSAGVAVPTMRKDFLVDPYQVVQARAEGAAGVLLITRMLSDSQLADMLGAAGEHGLFVLIEGFDEADLARVAFPLPPGGAGGGRSAAPLLLGLNTRNLADLTVDASRLERLAGVFPPGCVRVAESGLETSDDAARVARLGYGVALVGTALMRASRPDALVRSMIEAGRAAAARPSNDGSR